MLMPLSHSFRYAETLGYSDEEMSPIDIKEPLTKLPRPALPVYNGFGTLEDSLQNCLSLVPKPPRRDMHKLMNKDKIVMRFTVRMMETDTHKHSAIDLGRRFILSYFLMDDTIQVRQRVHAVLLCWILAGRACMHHTVPRFELWVASCLISELQSLAVNTSSLCLCAHRSLSLPLATLASLVASSWSASVRSSLRARRFILIRQAALSVRAYPQHAAYA